MASLSLNHIYKVYPNGVQAVKDFTFDIQDREFVVFVGPSGCGKSTTLRMIAGLEEITAGELYIDGKLVNDLDPSDRDIAMVFQNYALYPHMTVYENMAFGLRNRHVGKEEIDRLVKEAAAILDLTPYLDRKPKEMSGGQCQRVALGRAIVRNPKVFLLDEPLSNLDAKLRASMRTEISKLHQKLGTTFIYVTHDQVEAMTMGTRIVVMKDGVVQQIDAPIDLYDHPANQFVAGFIGTPQMNFFPALVSKRGTSFTLSVAELPETAYPLSDHLKFDHSHFDVPVVLGIRPDHVRLARSPSPYRVKVSLLERLGNETLVYGELLGAQRNYPITLKIPAKAEYDCDTILAVEFQSDELHFFDAETHESVEKRVPSDNRLSIQGHRFLGREAKIDQPNGEEGDALIVPLTSYVEGDDYELDIIHRETLPDFDLIGLDVEGECMFLRVPIGKCASGQQRFSFSLDWTKVSLCRGAETLVEAIPSSFLLPIHFGKGKDAEKKFCLSFSLGERSYALSHEESDKLLNIDGRKVLKKDYELELRVEDLCFEGDDYRCPIEATFRRGEALFARVTFLGRELILPYAGEGEEIVFSYRPQRFFVLDAATKMRCLY